MINATVNKYTISGIQFHKFFLEVFTNEELIDLIKNSTAYGSNCIVINSNDYFFELWSDCGVNKLHIYGELQTNPSNGKLFTKEEFLQIYKNK